MPTGDIKMCEETTHHDQLGNTGSCLCTYKKYPVKQEGPFIARCPFCGEQPEVANHIETEPPIPREVFCPTEGCPAFSNVVSLEVWNRFRAPHEQRVAQIPTNEPIFVLRAQDSIAPMIVWSWIAHAERRNVKDEKLNSAINDAKAMEAFQNEHGKKLPD
jgi:hypothetical protein